MFAIPSTRWPQGAFPLTVVGTDPAANAEFSQTVPSGELWWLVTVSVALVQGITQTPQPILVIDDGTNVIFQIPGSTAAQAVSTTCQYSWGADLQITGQIGATTNVNSSAPLPQSLVLPAGYRIRSNTVGIGANSNYGAPNFYVVKGRA